MAILWALPGHSSFHSQGSYEPFLPIPLPCPFPSPLISSAPSPDEEGRARTAILGAAVPKQWDDSSGGTSNIAGCKDPVSLPLARRESPISEPSHRLTWRLYFLVILLFTAKAPMSPSFMPHSLISAQGERRDKKKSEMQLLPC